jgi:ABC-type transport system substrate-binding protein
MKRKSMYTLLSVLMLLSMILAACAPAATPPPAAPTEAPQPTEAPAPTQAPPTEAPQPTAMPATEVPAATAAPTPLWTKELKQAIAAAIDREAIVDRVFEGRNTPAYNMIPPSYPGATEPFLDKYGTRNLDMAKQILTGLGYTADKPFTFDLWYPPDHYGTTTADVMQVVKEQLEETGLIKVNLQAEAWAQYIGEDVPTGVKFAAFILGWFPDFADPETWLTPFASCNQSPDQGVNYCNPEMDKLLDQARQETDQAKRQDLYKQISTLYAEEVPTLPLFWEPEYVTFRNGVKGVAIGSTFEFNYNVLSFDAGYKPASGKNDTIIIGTTDSIDSLDAADAYATADWEILKNTGQTLLTYEPGKAELVPGAADMPTVSADGKSYTFKLHPGIKYPDGTALKASDYVYAWTRTSTLKGQVASLLTNYIDSVEAPDDSTVVYHLKGAYAFFPALAATAPFVPVNPKTFPADKLNQLPDSLDGTGPYRMVSFKAGEQMVLEANPNYNGASKPIIKNVIIKYFAKPTTMSQAVENGEIDIAWRILGAVEATRLQSVTSVTVVKIDAPTLRYLVFNMKYVPQQ